MTRFFGWLRRRRELVLAEADEFMESYGDMAYRVARTEARSAREQGDRRREKLLNRVCKELARRYDYQIGLDTASRYLEDQEPYVIDGPPIVHKRPDDATLH